VGKTGPQAPFAAPIMTVVSQYGELSQRHWGPEPCGNLCVQVTSCQPRGVLESSTTAVALPKTARAWPGRALVGPEGRSESNFIRVVRRRLGTVEKPQARRTDHAANGRPALPTTGIAVFDGMNRPHVTRTTSTVMTPPETGLAPLGRKRTTPRAFPNPGER